MEEKVNKMSKGRWAFRKKVKVSIIIPYYNSCPYLMGVLSNLVINTSYPNYEIIVVNDGSEDFNMAKVFMKDLKNKFNIEIKWVDRKENKKFAYTCNEGANSANGDLLVFLNVDTIPGSNWLSKMIEIYKKKENTGIVGSKLLFPFDNLIQHIGGAINFSGKPFHLYKNTISALPFVNKVREVVHSTAASMLVSKKDFNVVGGFDDKEIKHTYEDTDFCFKIKFKLGKKIYVTSESILFHFENVTGGTSLYSENSLKILKKRWAKYLIPDEYDIYEKDGFSKELVRLFEKIYTKDFNVIYQFIKHFKMFEIEKQLKFVNSSDSECKIIDFISGLVKRDKILFINEQQIFNLLTNYLLNKKTKEILMKEYIRRVQKNKFFTNLYNHASLYLREGRKEKSRELFSIILKYKKYLRSDFIGKVYYKLSLMEEKKEKKIKLLQKALSFYDSHIKAREELKKLEK